MIQLYVRMMSALRSRSEDGAVATEYGVLIAFLAIALVATATALFTSLDGFFGRVGDAIEGWEP